MPPAPTVNVVVSPPSASVRAGSEFSFRANVSGSVDTSVTWEVNGVAGGNAITGTVDSRGLYTAPPAPPTPASVNVTAVAKADASKSATAVVTVTIGITVVPAVASLLLSSAQCPVSQQFNAIVSGTANSSVDWSVNGLDSGSPNLAFGSITTSGMYTSPSVIPDPPTFNVSATSLADSTQTASASVTVSAGGPVVNQNDQSGSPIRLGTSGGNSNDKTSSFCCSGTLGALVTRNGENFILSNNHVLARNDQAAPGEPITQPGLVDNRCQAAAVVANFTQAVPLQNSSGTATADAALAQVVPGEVDASGSILQLGTVSCGGRAQPAPPASTTITAAVGMPVAKSGRTTGLTCGTISAVNVDNVKVQYENSCGSSSTFTVTFNNQLVIQSSTFSAAGDSGSLIVDTATAQPTALLYAGDAGSGVTVANPIQDALSALPDPANQALPTIVGGDQHPVEACTGDSSSGAMQASARRLVSVAESEMLLARSVKKAHLAALVSDPAILGVGIGAGPMPRGAAIVIFIERGKPHLPIPDQLDGVSTRIEMIGPLRAFDEINCSSAEKVHSPWNPQSLR